ncbi:MAG TPA: guanosine monophosphate reductase [Anaerolineae bacterium]|nr:guanosine monophosphate reductase [Anaerolineae bacterium]
MELEPELTLTFDDVLLLPGYSEMPPDGVDLHVHLAPSIRLGIPILSAAMDTVTEAALAAELARHGGLGVIHRNLPLEAQAEQVAAVKQAATEGRPGAATDAEGRLLVAAAVGVTGDWLQRLDAVVEAGADLVAVDTAHGHSRPVLEAVAVAKERYPNLPLAAGNVATPQGTLALIEAGADVVKVGIGGGSICTTRVVAGVGVPQLSAIARCAEAARPHGVVIIADGGLRYSGDVVKALAAGAHCAMTGGMLAGVDEAPGAVVRVGGVDYKAYRGMGSLGAMQGLANDRYGGGGGKCVPEGVEGCVPCKGPLSEVLRQIVGGLRAGMGYVGAANLEELQAKARFVRISHAGLVESHPHSLIAIREAPNYNSRAAG